MRKQPIKYDFWQDHVMYYEFHTTMHQRNEKFISILNRICTNNHTKDDLHYLNRNCIQNAPNDPTFPYLFFTNRDVTLHTKKMLSIVPCEQIVIDAIYYEE